MVCASILAAVLSCAAQDVPGLGAQGGKKRDCCTKGKAKPWEGYNVGVQRTQPFDAALEKAKVEGKPVLLMYLVGDLDKEGC